MASARNGAVSVVPAIIPEPTGLQVEVALVVFAPAAERMVSWARSKGMEGLDVTKLTRSLAMAHTNTKWRRVAIGWWFWLEYDPREISLRESGTLRRYRFSPQGERLW